MRLLVTGAAGFIGSHFLELLLRDTELKKSKIVVVDALTYSGLISNIERAQEFGSFEFIEADIAESAVMEKIFAEFKITDCINFAAESHVDRSINSGEAFIRSNVLGTYNLLESFRRVSSGRYLQVSTDEVYGTISEGSWKEIQALDPNSPYSASKASADLIVQSFIRTHGINGVITRSSNNYGPRQFPEKFIPLAISNVIEGKRIPIYGTGQNVRDWIHVSDNCRAILQVFHAGSQGEIFNIGGNNELSNVDLAKLILSYMQVNADSLEFVPDRKAHDFRYSVDDSKLAKDLKFSRRIDFHEGLKQTIKWYADNVEWWSPLKVINV
jgi:dTDP-glucose 4,6-dehydratase